MLNKAMHKTKLTQNTKTKYTSNAKTKKTQRRDKKSDRITWSLFLSTPWKNLSIWRTLDLTMREKK